MKYVNFIRTIFHNKKNSLSRLPLIIGMGSLITANYSSGFKDTKIYSENEKPVSLFFY